MPWNLPQLRGIDGGETGSVTFVQRKGGTLGSFVHLHVVALDGVFTRSKHGAVVFHPGPTPSVADVTDVVTRVAERMLRWMRRRKRVDERPHEERSNEAPSQSPLEACMRLSLFGGTFLKLSKRVVPQPFARIDWASLIRRVFLEDVLQCPCGGRRRIHRSVPSPAALVAILVYLGLPARAPPVAPARDPGWFEAA